MDDEADGYSDVPEEVIDAALALCKMKHEKVDEETLVMLWGSLKGRTCPPEGKMVADHKEERDDVLLPANGDQDPCSERLEAIMGERSKPFAKKWMGSDLDNRPFRMKLSQESVLNHVIPLLRQAEDIHDGISVRVFDSNGVSFPMTLKGWNGMLYVLMGGWNRFFLVNDLEWWRNQWITVEAFRHADTDQLSFLISLDENTPVEADK